MALQADRELSLSRVYRGKPAPAAVARRSLGAARHGAWISQRLQRREREQAEAIDGSDASQMPDATADATTPQHKTTCAHNA
jgi:hypothetical protein